MKKKRIASRYINSFNKGLFLGTSIYSDVTGNKCNCGGKFTSRIKNRGLTIPRCSKCELDPPLYRILADVVDMNGHSKRITIRYSQDGERLNDFFSVAHTLKCINREMDEGSFDIRRYESISTRESFLFENVAKEFLAYHERRFKRNEITKAGFRRKKGLVENYLIPHFKRIDIGRINASMIKQFKNKFTEMLRTRDLALSELKTLLSFAFEFDYIQKIPKFDKIPKSKKRKNILTIEEAIEIINYVNHPTYRACFSLMTIYPIRPGELRALTWEDVDFKEKSIHIRRHISDNQIVEGRKSIKVDHEKGSITYPLTKEAELILKSLPIGFKKSELVFKGVQGGLISQNVLPRAWKKACNLAGKKYVSCYEIKHARLSEIAEQTSGDIVKMMAAGGHTNPNILLERYVRNRSDLTDIFH